LLHFLDPDQFHSVDEFCKFGSVEQFKEAIKQCELNSEESEKTLREMKLTTMGSIQ
jgi:hypothetical protein